jgi:hypothetical protein
LRLSLRFWIGIGVHALALANAGWWNSLLTMNWRREQKKGEDKQEFSVIHPILFLRKWILFSRQFRLMLPWNLISFLPLSGLLLPGRKIFQQE